MKRRNTFLRTLLLAAVAASPAVHAIEELPELQLEPDTQEQAHREAIETLESNHGAYASALPEQLLSLGLNLQHTGRHQEAMELFRRGVHLARINNGLYSAEQIPLLQREIASHIAMGQYSKADERQHYLYRVQMRSLESGLYRADALMQQARWQYNAYRLAVDGVNFNRLMNMWDLYRLALNDIVDREGQASLTLLKPLQGMLLAQYLIASYNYDNPSSSFSGGDTIGSQQSVNRFAAYRAQSYTKGRAVIQAIYDVQESSVGENTPETAETLTMMGDWSQWSNEPEAALQFYQQAIAELVAQGAAKEDIDEIFGTPVALPDYDGVRPLPEAPAGGENLLQLEFNVSATGKASDVERLDENDLSSGPVNRIMRRVRKTRFRPVLSMGEPVAVENVIRTYDIQ